MKRTGENEQQRWAAMAEALAGVGYWWMEAGSERIRWSPNMFRIFGFEPGDEPPFDLAMARLHPDDRTAAGETLRLALGGRASAGAVRVIWPSGEIRFIEGRTAPELGADGCVVAAYGALIDRTERVLAEAELAEARAAARAAAAVRADVAGPAPGSRLLIVDDHRVNRELARAMLSPWALEIAEAEDGHAALAAAEAGPFDLILMDVRMPGLDGPGAVVSIRQGTGPNRDTPILAFSADADGDSLHGLVDRGFDGVVGKPILAAELVAAVARWVRAPRPTAEAEAAARERASSASTT